MNMLHIQLNFKCIIQVKNILINPSHVGFLLYQTNKIIASASTLEADVKKKLKNTSDTNAATEIGKRIADKAIKAGVKVVAFDRSGYRYHGRVKALADSARENGLTF